MGKHSSDEMSRRQSQQHAPPPRVDERAIHVRVSHDDVDARSVVTPPSENSDPLRAALLLA